MNLRAARRQPTKRYAGTFWQVEELAEEGLELAPGDCGAGSCDASELYGGMDFISGHEEGHGWGVDPYTQPSYCRGWGLGPTDSSWYAEGAEESTGTVKMEGS